MIIRDNRLASLTASVLLLTAGCGTTTTTPASVASVEVSPPTSVLTEGQTLQLEARVEDAAGNRLDGRAVSWSSSAPSRASVDQNGRVTGVSSGAATIRAVTGGVEGTAAVTVRSRAMIVLDRVDVTFEAMRGDEDPPGEDIAITNGGEAQLRSLATSIRYLDGSSGWLSPSLRSTQAPTDLALVVSGFGLAAGTYRAQVDVESPEASNSPVPVNVTFRLLEPPPVIELSTDRVEMTAPETSTNPARASIDVTNSGGGELRDLQLEVSYPAGQTPGWLSAELTEDAAPTTVQLSASAGTLAPDVYTASVIVSADQATNSPQTTTVVFTVEPRGTSARTVNDPAVIRR